MFGEGREGKENVSHTLSLWYCVCVGHSPSLSRGTWSKYIKMLAWQLMKTQENENMKGLTVMYDQLVAKMG